MNFIQFICGLLFALALGKSAQAEPYQGQCDEPFSATTGGHCYWPSFRTLRANWYNAQTRCRLLHPRAHLAQFETSDELHDAVSFLSSASNCTAWGDEPNQAGPWIGALEVEASSEFLWATTNSGIQTSFWNSDEPNSPTAEDAIALTCSQGFKWQDMERAAELPFLCETEANPPAVTLACPDGFMLLGESCYAFRAEVRLSWDDSQEYCRNLTGQARLIEIETEQELHLITTFLRDNGTTTPYFWIGVEQRGESTHYQWASTKWPLTFYNWDDNQPNEVGSGNAIELYKKADWRWHDFHKSNSLFQLCETSPTEVTKGTTSG